MIKKSGFRFYVWLMAISAIVLAVTLAVTSVKVIRAGRNFTHMILEENKTFLINTLRFGHGVMAHMGSQTYNSLFDLALKSEFIGYLAVLDHKGDLIAQSTGPAEFVRLRKFEPSQLRDSQVLGETEGLLLISYEAKELVMDEEHKRHHATFKGPIKELPKPGWFLVGLDTSNFSKHYHDMVTQTVGVGITFLLFGLLIIVFFGVVQRYELAHLSTQKLQKIKSILSNFVPDTAKRIIEKDPDRALLDKYIQDATILFLDIEGFTTLVQEHPQNRVNRAIESYFSMFLEVIQRKLGDINETAGDGMMVIFLHSDPVQHARNAVQAALEIQKQCGRIAESQDSYLFPITVNIGISSGEVYLGSTKMRGTEGDRWTFTASGSVTILAARLSDYGSGGQILISEESARRLDQGFSLNALGRASLKNVKDSGNIYQVVPS